MSRVEAAPLAVSIILGGLTGIYISNYEHRSILAGAVLGGAAGGFIYLLKSYIYSKIDFH